MQQISEMTEDEMTEFAESFAWYEYGEGERGMVPFYPKFPDRTPLVNTRQIADGSLLYDLVREGKH